MVALCVPSLVILGRTRLYTPMRITIASAGLLFATSWMLERAGATAMDPFEPLTEWAVEHPFAIAISLAALALVGRTLPFERRQTPPVPALR